ncbi:MAG: DUF6268 family outer membrane beta-barrel protein [Candidatus Omnitrophota bacterium]
MVMSLAKKIHPGLLITAALLAFPFLANAETEKDTDGYPYCEVDSALRYEPRRTVRTVPGKVGIVKSDFAYKYGFKAFGKLPVDLSLDTGYIGIDNTVSSVELPARLVGLSTGIQTTLPFFNVNKTYFRIGVEPSFYADSWDFPASSFRIPSYYFVIYQPDPKWTFLYGIAVYPDFANVVLPVLGFIYKPNDRITFNIAPRRPNITYALNDKVSLFAEGNVAINKEFEVKHNESKNVVLRYSESYLGAGIKYNFNKYIRASFSTGGNFRRRLKYRDSLGKVDIKSGVYTEFMVEIRP